MLFFFESDVYELAYLHACTYNDSKKAVFEIKKK